MLHRLLLNSKTLISRRWMSGVGLLCCVGIGGCVWRDVQKTAPSEPVISYRDARNGRQGFVVPRAASPLFEPARAPELLDGAERDRWQQPARLVKALDLKPGDRVADIGAGSGYLLPYLSRAVGPKGLVYAEEIQGEFLPVLKKHAKRLGNVRVLLGTADDPRLPPRGVDCFVLLTVYHEVQQPVKLLRTLRGAARPNARLAIIDFDGFRKGDPPAPVGHQIADVQVIAEAQAAGWQLEKRHEWLGSQFFLTFR